jgi:D-psicose/D-tagatose/L-ribulose 3-epimerase
MKLASTISTYPTPFGPIVSKDGNLEASLKLQLKYGYEGADLFVKDTDEKTLKLYKRMFSDYGQSVVTLIAIFLGENGVKLSQTDEKLRARDIDLFKHQLDNVKTIGAKGIALGFIRGTHLENEREGDALKRIAESLHILGEYADSIGTTIMLEPINRYEINTLNRATDAVDFIKDNDLKGVSLLLDLFHMNIEEKSIYDSILYSKGLISNIHTPDSNRYAIGEGHFDFKKIISTLREADYDDFMTLEAFAPDQEQTLRQSANAILPLIK